MTKNTQTIDTGYHPRPLQSVLHSALKRFNVIVCHRRFGKTHFAVNEKIDKAFNNTLRNPQYAYIAPNYGQAKRVAWDLFKDYLRKVPGMETNESDLRIDIPRPQYDDKIRFMLLGSENYASSKGIYLDGATFDEFAESDPRIWSETIRPALSDRKGWANFIGTPKGQNHFHDVYQTAKRNPQTWGAFLYKASETGIIDPEELAANRAAMSPEEYEQEFECSFTAALIGSYYGKILNKLDEDKRITGVPYDPAVPVDTFWDLGVGDTTVIWFIQQVGKEIHVIDYYEMSGVGLPHYAKILKERDYHYGEHVMPHDAEARSLETGRTRVQSLRELGLKKIRVLKRADIEDGIEAVRMVLPRCWFDKTKCERGLTALKNYEKKYDPKNKIFSSTPLHNWASNGADAFRTFAMGFKDESRRINGKDLPKTSDFEFDIFQGRVD